MKRLMWGGFFVFVLITELSAQNKDSLEFIPDSLLLNDVTLTCTDGVDYSEIVLINKNGEKIFQAWINDRTYIYLNDEYQITRALLNQYSGLKIQCEGKFLRILKNSLNILNVFKEVHFILPDKDNEKFDRPLRKFNKKYVCMLVEPDNKKSAD